MKRKRVVTKAINRQPVEIVPDKYEDFHKALDKAKEYTTKYIKPVYEATSIEEKLKNIENAIAELKRHKGLLDREVIDKLEELYKIAQDQKDGFKEREYTNVSSLIKNIAESLSSEGFDDIEFSIEQPDGTKINVKARKSNTNYKGQEGTESRTNRNTREWMRKIGKKLLSLALFIVTFLALTYIIHGMISAPFALLIEPIFHIPFVGEYIANTLSGFVSFLSSIASILAGAGASLLLAYFKFIDLIVNIGYTTIDVLTKTVLFVAEGIKKLYPQVYSAFNKVIKEGYTMAKNIANRTLDTLKNLINLIREKFSNR